MLLIDPVGARFGIAAVTFVQVLPSSLVTWTSPSLLPAQITPRAAGDSAMAKSTQYASWLSAPSPGDGPSFVLSLVVRSGLMTVQVCPLSVVRWTNWLPAYAVCGSCGESANAAVQFIRYWRSARAPAPPPRCPVDGHGFASRVDFARVL